MDATFMKLAEIERLTDELFRQKWTHFHTADFSDNALSFPGVYLLAFSSRNLSNLRIEATDILYVGMSNAQGGVRSRLIQFRNGIQKYGIHSGAMRFYREYQNNRPWSEMRWRKKLFYAAISIQCASEKSKVTARDLRELGHVSCLEYYAIARIRQRTGRPPPLNKFGKRAVQE